MNKSKFKEKLEKEYVEIFIRNGPLLHLIYNFMTNITLMWMYYLKLPSYFG